MFDSNPNNAYGGYQYTPQNGAAPVKQPSVLTPDEYNTLIKDDNSFNLQLTQEEYLRGICNHRTLDGTGDTLVQTDDGKIRCTVCGWEFDPINTNTDDSEIREAVKLVEDILQTIKLLYVEMPPAAQREYFQIIPLLGKVPELFQIAVKNFAKYENYNGWSYRNGNTNTMNLYNAITQSMNQPYSYNGYNYNAYDPQQAQYYQAPPQPGPGYAVPPQQSVNPSQPVGATPPTSNGFGYYGPGMPQPMPNPYQPVPPQANAYQPQQQGYAYTPTQAPAQPGAQQPTEATSETDGQTVQTQATFKA